MFYSEKYIITITASRKQILLLDIASMEKNHRMQCKFTLSTCNAL